MTQKKNRLHAASRSQVVPRLIRLDLQRSIGTQQRAIERLTAAALEFVPSDPLHSVDEERFVLLGFRNDAACGDVRGARGSNSRHQRAAGDTRGAERL